MDRNVEIVPLISRKGRIIGYVVWSRGIPVATFDTRKEAEAALPGLVLP